VQEGKQYQSLLNAYGKCNIVIPDKGMLTLLVEEILTPFYIFQVFSVLLWFIDHYAIYAS